jgi:hypothetical protein
MIMQKKEAKREAGAEGKGHNKQKPLAMLMMALHVCKAIQN